jgi:hypothetical protein
MKACLPVFFLQKGCDECLQIGGRNIRLVTTSGRGLFLLIFETLKNN